jgi:hypothetical protein
MTGNLWGMPFDLIGQVTQDPSIKITDWLPLAVVAIGGYITYYANIKLEHNKRRFDLKKQVYLEVVEIFSDISRFEIIHEFSNIKKAQNTNLKMEEEIAGELAENEINPPMIKISKTQTESSIKPKPLTDAEAEDQLSEFKKEWIKEIKDQYLSAIGHEWKKKWNKYPGQGEIIEKLIVIKYKLILCDTPNHIIKKVEELTDCSKRGLFPEMKNKINDLMNDLVKDLDKFKRWR